MFCCLSEKREKDDEEDEEEAYETASSRGKHKENK